MAKPYDFTSPILTEKSLERIAYDIEQKYATTESVQEAVAGVDLSEIEGKLSNKVDKVEGSSLATSAQLTQIETNKTNVEDLQTRVGSIESDLDGLLAVLEEVV